MEYGVFCAGFARTKHPTLLCFLRWYDYEVFVKSKTNASKNGSPIAA